MTRRRLLKGLLAGLCGLSGGKVVAGSKKSGDHTRHEPAHPASEMLRFAYRPVYRQGPDCIYIYDDDGRLLSEHPANTKPGSYQYHYAFRFPRKQ
jgi:hypothetical protein